MEDFAELRDLAGVSDDVTSRRLLRYIELRQAFTELTGDETVHEPAIRCSNYLERLLPLLPLRVTKGLELSQENVLYSCTLLKKTFSGIIKRLIPFYKSSWQTPV